MDSEIIIVPSLFFMIGYIVYVIVDGYRRRQQTRVFTEFHAQAARTASGRRRSLASSSAAMPAAVPDVALEQRRRCATAADPAFDADRIGVAGARHRVLHASQ